MADIAALQVQLAIDRGFVAALRQAQGSGMRRVSYADRTIEYQSIADLLAAETAALNRIADAERLLGGRRRTRQVVFVGGKGL